MLSKSHTHTDSLVRLLTLEDDRRQRESDPVGSTVREQLPRGVQDRILIVGTVRLHQTDETSHKILFLDEIFDIDRIKRLAFDLNQHIQEFRQDGIHLLRGGEFGFIVDHVVRDQDRHRLSAFDVQHVQAAHEVFEFEERYDVVVGVHLSEAHQPSVSRVHHESSIR